MTDAFKSWILKPGNHRLIRNTSKQLSELLEQKVELSDWASVYSFFIAVAANNAASVQIFKAVFESQPPTQALGASPEVISMYQQLLNGGSYKPPAVAEPTAKKRTVTYRGQTVELDVEKPQKVAPQRLYRGRPISDDES